MPTYDYYENRLKKLKNDNVITDENFPEELFYKYPEKFEVEYLIKKGIFTEENLEMAYPDNYGDNINFLIIKIANMSKNFKEFNSYISIVKKLNYRFDYNSNYIKKLQIWKSFIGS